jgi:predicted DNA-binding helix-hairpin-helix protein
MSLRDTPTTYSAKEAEQIRDTAEHPGSTLVCPRCNTPMDRGPCVEVHGVTMQEICCPDCQRCVMLRDPPEA